MVRDGWIEYFWLKVRASLATVFNQQSPLDKTAAHHLPVHVCADTHTHNFLDSLIRIFLLCRGATDLNCEKSSTAHETSAQSK